jgi:hypothetical protein
MEAKKMTSQKHQPPECKPGKMRKGVLCPEAGPRPAGGVFQTHKNQADKLPSTILSTSETMRQESHQILFRSQQNKRAKEEKKS